VTAVRAQFDERTQDFSEPVTIEVDLPRFGVKLMDGSADVETAVDHRKVMDAVVAHGMRAQLRTGSLLSGALYVAIDFFPNAPPATLDWAQNPVQLPTIPGQIQEIEARLASVVTK